MGGSLCVCTLRSTYVSKSIMRSDQITTICQNRILRSLYMTVDTMSNIRSLGIECTHPLHTRLNDEGGRSLSSDIREPGCLYGRYNVASPCFHIKGANNTSRSGLGHNPLHEAEYLPLIAFSYSFGFPGTRLVSVVGILYNQAVQYTIKPLSIRPHTL